jgi:hypothetical protein
MRADRDAAGKEGFVRGRADARVGGGHLLRPGASCRPAAAEGRAFFLQRFQARLAYGRVAQIEASLRIESQGLAFGASCPAGVSAL